ncbi:MAG: TetR/AcrR family transcriptional regulator [Gammaproteobacteria bacterium]|nr:TetR/AcrR family transcriptional regulator [Gammaproteobacteria bacterium]
MTRVTAEKVLQTKTGILEAAREVLQHQGFAGLSTRGVASAAGVPLSQIQYHFGSKDGMLLALYEYMNAQLLERQNQMFTDPDLTFAKKWDLACDYLDTDIESGYVRVLQELMAAGWSNPEIGDAVREGLMGWFKLLTQQADELIAQHDICNRFSARELAALIDAVFLGAEAAILLNLEDQGIPYRQALRRFGRLLEQLDQNT